jgi:hypothetical protein
MGPSSATAAAPVTHRCAPPLRDLQIPPGRCRIQRPKPPPPPRTPARHRPRPPRAPHRSNSRSRRRHRRRSPSRQIRRTATAAMPRVDSAAPANSPHHPRESCEPPGERASSPPSLGSARDPGGRPSGGSKVEEGGRRVGGGALGFPRVACGGDAGEDNSVCTECNRF